MINNDWTQDEQDLLVLLAKRGKKQAAIAKELGRTERAVNSQIYRLRKGGIKIPLGWYEKEGTIIGHLDIETDNFDADAGLMLAWCVKIDGGALLEDVVNKKELDGGVQDKRIVQSLLEILQGLDVVTTFWGTGMDIPFLRSRALFHKLDFPLYGTIAHFDLFYACRSLFKLHRKSLQAVTEFLGIEGKTHLKLPVWQLAKRGHAESLKYVLEHCRADVQILEELWKRVRPYRKWTRKSI